MSKTLLSKNVKSKNKAFYSFSFREFGNLRTLRKFKFIPSKLSKRVIRVTPIKNVPVVRRLAVDLYERDSMGNTNFISLNSDVIHELSLELDRLQRVWSRGKKEAEK